MKHKLFTLTLTLIYAATALAGVPQRIPYQGFLTDAAGDPVADGAHLVKFVIYDSPVGGAVMWDAGFQTINTVNGLFSYELGSATPLPNNLFIDTARYLGITSSTDPELTPRVKLNAQAYAYQALRADSAGYADLLDGLNASDFALAGHNHDGTYATVVHNHDAADIVSGLISESRFDAYSDLSISGRLDNNSTTDLLTRSQSDGRFSSISHTHPADITSVTAGTGLNGGGTSGAVTLSVDPTDFNGSSPATDSWGGNISSTGSDVTLKSLSISVPVSGRIIAIGKSDAECGSGCSAATDYVWAYMTIANSSTASASTGSYSFGRINLYSYNTMTCMETFSVSTGTHTYYLRGRSSTGTGGTRVDFNRPQLQLIFIPN